MQAKVLVTGFVFAAVVGLGGGLASTAGTNEQSGKTKQAEQPVQRPADHAPPPLRGNLDRLEILKLDEILSSQERLLQRLDALEGTTTQFNTLHNSIIDGIVASQAELIKIIGGLEFQCTTPDLLPLPAPGSTAPYGFCQFTDDGKLIVRVHNQGGALANASTARVTFFGSPAVDQPTPALAAFGGAADLLFDIPESCFPSTGGDTQCDFTISVDFGNVVAESNESNNTVAGTCVRVG